MRNYVIDMNLSTLEDRIRLKRVLESNRELIYFSRCNIGGIMLDSTWETEDGCDCWNRLAFTGTKWDLVNMSFTPNISLDEFVEKYKCLD